MKRALTLVAVLMLAAFSYTMPLTIGAGLNMSSVSGSGDYEEGLKDAGMRIGFNVGVTTTIALNDKMGVVTGLAYETRGMTQEMTMFGIDIEVAANANYLQIPVLFSYSATPELAINVGPEIGIFLSGTSVATVDGTETEADMEDVSTLDLGLSLNVAYTLMEKFVIGAGYYMGFLNTDAAEYDPAPDGGMTNTNIKIMVGYKLAL